MKREAKVRKLVEKKAKEGGAERVAVAMYDYETGTSWTYHADEPFHAASTIKVAVLAALLRAVDEGKFKLGDRLHVRNLFRSAADGKPFQVTSGRDANADVHRSIGKTMRVEELALHMIATSSNLATNLLVDLLGVDYVRETLEWLGVKGVDFNRGVEDERAFEEGVSNELTAAGLLQLVRAIYEGERFSKDATEKMMEILFQQEFSSGIPAGVPSDVRERARFAHKTGEISTVAHDGGLVFLPDRKPYALVILTRWDPDATGRRDTIADLSEIIYNELTDADG